MAEAQKSNLTSEQKAAIEHHVIQEAKEIFGTVIFISRIIDSSKTQRLDPKIQKWAEEKRNELSNSSPEKLDKLVKEHQKFLEIQSLDTNRDREIDKSESPEFIAKIMADVTAKLNINNAPLKEKHHYSAAIDEIKRIAQKHNLTISDEAAQAGLDSYNESSSTTSKLPRKKPEQTTKLQ